MLSKQSVVRKLTFHTSFYETMESGGMVMFYLLCVKETKVKNSKRKQKHQEIAQ